MKPLRESVIKIGLYPILVPIVLRFGCVVLTMVTVCVGCVYAMCA